jgi:hypothetical protein
LLNRNTQEWDTEPPRNSQSRNLERVGIMKAIPKYSPEVREQNRVYPGDVAALVAVTSCRMHVTVTSSNLLGDIVVGNRDGDVVRAALLQGQINQSLAGAGGGHFLVQHGRDLLVFYRFGQTVRAEQ